MLILNGVETKLEVSMENEIKSVSDIISEISKKDKNSFYCYSTENKPFFKPKHNGK